MRKKILLISLLLTTNALAATYVAHIPKNIGNNYVKEEKINIPDLPWEQIAEGYDLSMYYPVLIDNSSSAQAIYDVNFGQKKFKGDPKGFSAYDSNYDSSKWSGATLQSNGSVQISKNINYAKYEERKSTGQYYFEIEVIQKPHADIIGFKDITRTGNYYYQYVLGIGKVGYNTGGLQMADIKGNWRNWLQNGGLQPAGTVFQFWIDFDNRLFSVMELGTSKDDYVNYHDYY